MNREILFYRTAAGQCPVSEFLDALPSKVAQKVTWVLVLIEEFNIVPSRYFCKMEGTEDIWECRVKFASNIYRILAFWDGCQIILTHGFIKKEQKTSPSEIERAESYKADYFIRKRGSR